MRGLTLVVATGDPERYEAALTMAAATAAAGARARVYLHGRAVALATPPHPLAATLLDLGGALIVCQTGLAEAGLAADRLDARIEAAGMVHLLATLGDDRLVAV